MTTIAQSYNGRILREKLPLKEKIGYGFGDFASSMFWKLFSMYLMIFYTDVFEITPASVGTMFLLTRIWDAINDPLMGIISDRTTTRYGKFRPYLLWVAVPFAVIGILTFTTPDYGPTGKLVYAYVTYTLMMMVYTAINVPYSSLMGVMTPVPAQRTTLATYRFIGAFAGGIFVTATASQLINYFKAGGASEAQGYQYTIAIYAIAAAVLFFLTFKLTRERVEPLKKASTSVRKDLKDLLRNGPWFILLGANISALIFTTLRETSMQYYFKYYVQTQEVSFFGVVEWEGLFSAYGTIWLAMNLFGVILAKPFSTIVGKKKAFIYAMLVSGVISMFLYALKPEQISLIFGLNILLGISAGIILPLGWSMYADIADYSEWKTGRRATGLIFSSSSMSQKFGWTLGGAFAGWLLAAYGFEANMEQTQQSLTGIQMMLSVYPGIAALLSAFFVMLYKLDDKTADKISMELEQKRNASDN